MAYGIDQLVTTHASHWEWVALLTPSRLDCVDYVDRLVRGESWMFVHNNVTGKHVRVNALARRVVMSLNGSTSIELLLEASAPNCDSREREALANCLITLVQYGLMSLDQSAAQQRLQRRIHELTPRDAKSWQNPLAIRVPLINPDNALEPLMRVLEFCPGKRLLQLALCLMGFAILCAIFNKAALGQQILLLTRTPQQWWQLLLVYPILKLTHELAHAIVIKRFGGAVHEAGITVLVLMPIPYVDASDSWRFESRYQRVLVSAAGMVAEGILAALGLFVFLLVEPGFFRDLGFAVALLGSVSTLLFNANPLLKFDGYHIAQDLLDMPNLGPRASRYLRYLCRRYLLGINTADTSVTAMGERRWLVGYGISAALYRWVITLGIALYLAMRFPVLGSLLALFALYQLGCKPLLLFLRYLLSASELDGLRARALSVTGGLISAALVAVFVLPVPMSTRAQGVVSVPRQAQMFAPQSGEIEQINVFQGQPVERGQLIMQLDSPELQQQLFAAQNELDKRVIAYQAAVADMEASAIAHREDVKAHKEIVQTLQKRVMDLQVRAPVSGRVNLEPVFNRPGQFVTAGNALGHVVDPSQLRVRAIVHQRDISRVEQGVRSVKVRLAENFKHPLSARLVQQTPSGNHELPSQALALGGQSGIAVASGKDNQWKTQEPVFHLEFALPPDVSTAGVGGRAYVSLVHAPASIGDRTLRALRQLLLDRLAI